MALRSITVKVTKTLTQVDEILEMDPEGQETVKQAIIDAIDKLHSKIINGDTNLLLTDNTEFTIRPKKEFKQFMYDVTGEKGPYKVLKTYKSWVGMSDGVYEVENCPKYIPVSWCDKASKSNLNAFSALLAFCSILQSVILILLLI